MMNRWEVFWDRAGLPLFVVVALLLVGGSVVSSGIQADDCEASGGIWISHGGECVPPR